MSGSDYEKKRDEAANAYCRFEAEPSEYSAFKAGSDFGREYNQAAYDQLMEDAMALQAALDLIMEVDNTYDSKTWDIADKASGDFDKKYPQANEKE